MRKENNKLQLIDAPVYSYWEALYKSFYSTSLYVDVGKRWTGLGLLYLLFVIGILAIPVAIKAAVHFNQSFNDQIILPLSGMPTVYIQAGEASFDKPMPYMVKNKKDQVILIADTTGVINKFSPEYPYLGILINKNSLSFRLPVPKWLEEKNEVPKWGEPTTQSFDKNESFILDGNELLKNNHIEFLKYVTEAMIYPIMVGMLYSMFIIIFLVLSLLGQIFASIFFSFKLSFAQSSRLFFMATTPMLFSMILLLIMNWVFTGAGFILLGIAAIYFSIGVSALKKESKHVVLR